jgi:pimeloyl-ACP methyl ester carboxylesterase
MAVASSADVYVPRRAPRQHHVPGRRGRIALTSWGPQSDSPIVLLHGWMDCGAAFQLLVDCLPDDWSLTAVDWPGYGQSESYEGGYWLPEYLAELDWLLDQLSPARPARIIGHSLGGTVASMYAGLRPQRLQWVVNLEGYGAPRRPADDVPSRLTAWLDVLREPKPARRYPSFEDLAKTVLARNPRLPPANARFLAHCWARAVPQGVQLLADVQHQWPSPIRYAPDELDACLAGIRVPILLVTSEHAEYFRQVGGADLVARWRSLVPTLEVSCVADTAHMLHNERPAATAAEVREFVARLR